MIRKILLFFFIFIITNQLLSNDNWPKDLDRFTNSTCIVEFYQPQNENSDINDRSRIKRNLTGLLVSESGLILTTEEIYPANLDISTGSFYFYQSQDLPEDITVKFADDQKFKAKFLGKDEETKLAFLQIQEPKNLPQPVEFKLKSEFKIGQPIFLVERLSENYDFEPIVTSEYINSVIKKPRKKLLINSTLSVLSNGGLVVNQDGNAIGVVQNNRQSYGYHDEMMENRSTVIEILLAPDFQELIHNPPKMSELKNGTGKSWLGIQMQILSKDMADYWALDNTSGVIINKIVPESPAEIAGLNIGDIIVSIDDFSISGEDEKNLDIFRTHVRNLSKKNVDLEYIRDGKIYSTNVHLRSAPKSQFLAEEKINQELGFSVKELTQDIFLNYDIDFDTEGVWVSKVESAGIASIAGLRLGDLILKINNKTISNIDEFENYLTSVFQKDPEYIQLFILRQNKTQFLFLKIRKDTFN